MSRDLALAAVEAFLDAADRGELDADDTVKAWSYREARDRVDDACRDL